LTTISAGANLDLPRDSRYEIYDRWCKASARRTDIAWRHAKNQVKTFLILETRQPAGAWSPIGVSIILPLLRHLAEFWDPEKTPNMLLLTEPDNPKIECLIQAFGFRRTNRPPICGDVFDLSFPLDPNRYLPDHRAEVFRMVKQLRSTRDGWPIVRAK
jgi:hypothetical protein